MWFDFWKRRGTRKLINSSNEHWKYQRVSSESDIGKLEIRFRDFEKRKIEQRNLKHVNLWKFKIEDLQTWSPKKQKRETPDTKFEVCKTHRIPHDMTSTTKYLTTTMTNRKPREPLAQQTKLFAYVFIHSGRAVLLHISRVFTCVSCVVLFSGSQISEWKRTTETWLVLSELMETPTITK